MLFVSVFLHLQSGPQLTADRVSEGNYFDSLLLIIIVGVDLCVLNGDLYVSNDKCEPKLGSANHFQLPPNEN